MRAIDQAGNADASPASFTWSVDTIAPSTQIDSHPTALTNSAAATFTFSGSDPGGSGVASFECKLDAGAFAPCSSPKELSGLGDGSHTFEVRAIDNAGNTDATPASFTWTVDITAPDTQIDTHPLVFAPSNSASFGFSGSDTGGSGVASFECRRDSEEWAACGSPRSYAALAEGPHSFEVRAIDQAGNKDQSPASFTWTVDTIAPTTQIDTHPSALVNVATATFTFSGADAGGSGVASFECKLDAGAFAPCSSPRELSGLGDGSHSFEVRAVDNAGNTDASPASFTWSVDTTAPSTQIDTHPSALVKVASASFTFSGSDPGGSGVASFECKLDAGAFAPCSSPRELSGLGDGSHSFEVRAIDNAGNADASPASFSWSVDTTAPSTQIDTHPLVFAPSNSASFGFSGSDTGGSGVASFECRRDSEEWAACGSPRSYAALAEGPHSFEVRAIDQAGNKDQSPASFTWTVDTIAPTTQIDTHPSALVNVATATFTFSGADAGGSGVASFECKLDAGAFAPCSSPRELSGLGDGSHSFEVRAVDNAGNTDASPASFTWSVDTTAPSTQIDTHPSALVNVATATFTFSGSDGGGSGVASFECKLDAGAFAPCSSPRELSGLADGSHSFEVRAVDKAGNKDQSPASFSWSVDATAPRPRSTPTPRRWSTSRPRPSPSPAPTPAAPASPRSNASSTPAPSRRAPRRGN